MKRYVLRTVWECLSAFQLGSIEQVPTTDKRTARDGRGRLYVPGTACAGVLRALIRASCGETAERALFGYQEGDDGRRSALLIDHGFVLTGSIQPEIRDFVRIDRRLGTAEDRKKFDWEILPAGTRISLRMECGGEEGDPALEAFLMLARFLRDGREWQLGGGFAKGIGRVRAMPDRFQLWGFGFPDQRNAREYFALLRAESEGGKWDAPGTGSPCLLAGERLEQCLGNREELRQGVSVEIELEACGPFLIGDGKSGETCDIVPFRENKKYVAPGSSFRGAMRHRAERIVNTLLAAKGFRPASYEVENKPNDWARVGEAFVEPLFGSVNRASLLGVSDSRLLGRTQQVQSVTIDRFTGGAREARLFSSEVFWSRKNPLRFSLRLTLRPDLETEDRDALLGLLAHVLYDLGSGDLPVGRAKTSGHGVFRALGVKIEGLGRESVRVGEGGMGFAQARRQHLETLRGYQKAFKDWLERRAGSLYDPQSEKQKMLERALNQAQTQEAR